MSIEAYLGRTYEVRPPVVPTRQVLAATEANGVSPDFIRFVIKNDPFLSELPPQQEEEGGCSVHIVVLGDTLWSLAEGDGPTVEAIARANNLADPNLIRTGQRLTIPCGQAVGTEARPTPTPTATATEVVQQAEVFSAVETPVAAAPVFCRDVDLETADLSTSNSFVPIAVFRNLEPGRGQDNVVVKHTKGERLNFHTGQWDLYTDPANPFPCAIKATELAGLTERLGLNPDRFGATEIRRIGNLGWYARYPLGPDKLAAALAKLDNDLRAEADNIAERAAEYSPIWVGMRGLLKQIVEQHENYGKRAPDYPQLFIPIKLADIANPVIGRIITEAETRAAKEGERLVAFRIKVDEAGGRVALVELEKEGKIVKKTVQEFLGETQLLQLGWLQAGIKGGGVWDLAKAFCTPVVVGGTVVALELRRRRRKNNRQRTASMKLASRERP